MKTKAQLKIENTQLAKDNNILFLALADVVNTGGKTFGNSRRFSILITRPQSACGGIAIVRRNGMVSAHYFEDFAREELARIALLITGHNDEFNRELLCIRSAIEDAKSYTREQQAAA